MKIKQYIKLARVSNTPTLVSNVLAGAALAGVTVPNGHIVLLIIGMILYYSAGMMLNDICDYAWDKQKKTHRPLIQGTITQKNAGIATLLLFGIGTSIFFWQSEKAFFSSLALLACIVIYNLWHKNNPIGPAIMAMCRVLVYVIAFFAFAISITNLFLIACSFLFLYMVTLTWIAKTYRNEKLTLFLIAGISLYDGIILIITGSFIGALIAVCAFGLTLFLNTYIRGT